jgi:hypothetical protein
MVCVCGGGVGCVTDKAVPNFGASVQLRSCMQCVCALHTTQTIPSLNCTPTTPQQRHKRNTVCRRRRHDRQAEQRGALPLPARRVAGSHLFVRLRFFAFVWDLDVCDACIFSTPTHPQTTPSNKHQHRRNAHIRARRAECYEPSVVDSCCWFVTSSGGNAAAAVKYADMSLTVGLGARWCSFVILFLFQPPKTHEPAHTHQHNHTVPATQ